MADTKVSALTAAASATADDLLYLVDGAAVSKKITFANTESSINHTNITAGDGSDHSDVAANTLKDTNVSTNITVVEAPTNVDIQSSDGTNDTIAAADITNAGVMTTTMYDNHILNNAKNTDVDHNVTTNLSAGTRTATTIDVNSSDGTNATLVEADTTNAGILGSDKWDEIVANSVHTADNTQAHTDYLINNGADTTNNTLATTGDFDISGPAIFRNILIGTEATPGTASGWTKGTVYMQYTA